MLETWGQKVRAGQGSAGESGHLLLHVVGQLSVVVDVDEERECAPSIIPSCPRRRHTLSRHFPPLTQSDNVEKDWQDWRLEQLSGEVRRVCVSASPVKSDV